MKFISMDAIMTRRQSFVFASFAVAMMVGAITFGATSPAFAGRQVHASDVARLLSGRAFRIECIDGTIGRGQVSVRQHDAKACSSRRSVLDRIGERGRSNGTEA